MQRTAYFLLEGSTMTTTKQGEHGTLYLYRVKYRDVSDHYNDGTCAYWAYDAEHALDRFYDSPDDGWEHVGIPRKTKR